MVQQTFWEDRHLPKPKPKKINTCWKCVKKNEGFETDAEAIAACMKDVAAVRDSRERTIKHKAVLKEVKQMQRDGLKFQGWNRKELRKAAINGIEEILDSLLPYINREIEALQAQ